MTYDVLIIGGGPAGLQAALALGRAQKRVLLCDAGTPRNEASEGVHTFVTRDGILPSDFRRIAREQLTPYTTVEPRRLWVRSIEREGELFRADTDEGAFRGRRVLLATGLVDVLPEIPGLRELWGRSVFSCPYCHGWEIRGQRFGILTDSPAMLEFALFLKGWTDDVVAFTHASAPVPAELRERLGRAGIPLEEQPVRRFVEEGGHLRAVELEDGRRVERDAFFLRPEQRQTALVQQLGVALNEHGFVRIDERKQTSVPGVHAAGDLTTHMQGALFSAAEGGLAAFAINYELTLAAHP